MNSLAQTRLISYRAKPEKADENERLIAHVFEQLAQKAPVDLSYLAVRTVEDNFVHIVSSLSRPSPLLALPAFQAFQASVSQRWIEEPEIREVRLIGAYG